MDASTEVEAEFVSEQTMRDEWNWSEILFSILCGGLESGDPYDCFYLGGYAKN